MKKLLYTLVLTTAFISVKSQVFLNTGAGASFTQGAKAMGELNVGYNLNSFTVAIGFQAFVNSSQPIIPQVRVGRVFCLSDKYSIEPSIGYAFLLYSAEYSAEDHSPDKLSPNKGVLCSRIEFDRYISDEAQFYLSGSLAGNIPAASIGIKTSF